MQRWLHYGSYDDDDVHCRYYRILMKKLQNWIVTPNRWRNHRRVALCELDCSRESMTTILRQYLMYLLSHTNKPYNHIRYHRFLVLSNNTIRQHRLLSEFLDFPA
ncbi:hypothetical protein HanIR_Chr13g0656061 [Helianthus annuus]|nr:hypothetical protein HanIR_Chr13g0656061 [Helianthus annuus]